MLLPKVRTRLMRWLLPLTTGGSVFFLRSCDEDVRATVIDGLNEAAVGLSQSLLDAFFQSLVDDGGATAARILQSVLA